MSSLVLEVGDGPGTEVEIGPVVGPDVAAGVTTAVEAGAGTEVEVGTAVGASVGTEVEVGLTAALEVDVPEEVAGAPQATPIIVSKARPVMKYRFTCSPWPASECSTNNRHSSYRHVRTHIDTPLQMGKR